MKNKNDKYVERILITQKEIEEKCVELANWVDQEYKDSKNLVLVGLLKGSIPFMAQLIKNIQVEHVMDFMTISSYGGGVASSGNIKIVMDLVTNIADKDVLIIEDIVDSGRTLTRTIDMLEKRGPKSLKVLTLLDKPAGRVTEFEVDKFGFEVPNEFLYGFGLDVKEKLRNIPYIAVFNKDELDNL